MLPRYLFWRDEAGKAIPIDSTELIDVVRHDILSQNNISNISLDQD